MPTARTVLAHRQREWPQSGGRFGSHSHLMSALSRGDRGVAVNPTYRVTILNSTSTISATNIALGGCQLGASDRRNSCVVARNS